MSVVRVVHFSYCTCLKFADLRQLYVRHVHMMWRENNSTVIENTFYQST